MDFLKLTENLKGLSDEEFEKLEKEKKTEQDNILKDKRLVHFHHSEESGVQKRFYNACLDNFIPETEQEKKIKWAIIRFLQGEGKQMLFFHGNCGTGKTHLGCAIIREKGGRIISSFELCTRYEMGADFNAKQNRLEVLKEFSEVEMLVIDEIGRGKQEIEKLVIPYIINARYENMKPLVLITNLSKEQFCNLMGTATLDRLNEICSTLVFDGKSRRK